MFRKFIKPFFRKFGFDVLKYECTLEWRRRVLFSHYNFGLVFDVGANIGQYAERMRKWGYRGRIVSFEPLSSAYKILAERAKDDPLWETRNIALGNYDGKVEINISENSCSSSILDILPTHVQSAPLSICSGREEVIIRRIDSIFDDYYYPGEKFYLKVDTQGYEKHVIEGAERVLDILIGIEMEASLVPLYKGEPLLAEMIGFMSDKGYTLMSLEPGFYNRQTGQLLQVDCRFFRQQVDGAGPARACLSLN